MTDAVTRWLMSPGRGEVLPSLEDWLARPEWMRDAACRATGTAVFIRGRGGDYGAARALCAACEVRAECLEVALANPELVGLWGGTSDRERREMRRGSAAT